MSKVRELIVIDTETTGIDENSEPLQVSIIDGSGAVLMNEYFRPVHTTEWPQAEAVNGITPEMVKTCRTISEAGKEIADILNAAEIIVGYNTMFDIGLLMRSIPEIDKSAEKKAYDCMSAFAPIYGEWSEERQQYKWKSLSVCAEYFGYEWGDEQAHDSLADCKATLHCYNAIMQYCEKKAEGD